MSAAPPPPASLAGAETAQIVEHRSPFAPRRNALTVSAFNAARCWTRRIPRWLLQTFQARERIQPRIPLGKRGKLDGCEWEAIGFQERTITVEASL